MNPEETKWTTPRHVDVRAITASRDNSDCTLIMKCDSVNRGEATVGVKRIDAEGLRRGSNAQKKVRIDIIDQSTVEYSPTNLRCHEDTHQTVSFIHEEEPIENQSSIENFSTPPLNPEEQDLQTASTLGSIIPMSRIRNKNCDLEIHSLFQGA